MNSSYLWQFNTTKCFLKLKLFGKPRQSEVEVLKAKVELEHRWRLEGWWENLFDSFFKVELERNGELPSSRSSCGNSGVPDRQSGEALFLSLSTTANATASGTLRRTSSSTSPTIGKWGESYETKAQTSPAGRAIERRVLLSTCLLRRYVAHPKLSRMDWEKRERTREIAAKEILKIVQNSWKCSLLELWQPVLEQKVSLATDCSFRWLLGNGYF